MRLQVGFLYTFVSSKVMKIWVTACLVGAALLLGQICSAQSLPTPSRTVFKCTQNGKVIYSDSPCLGAQRLEIEPTRGVSKLTGKEKIGSDVRNEVNREVFAQAVRPLTGMNDKELKAFGKRQKLTAEWQRECHAMDIEIPLLEAKEKSAVKEVSQQVQQELFRVRSRYRAIGC
jgi:hypothetical protein